MTAPGPKPAAGPAAACDQQQQQQEEEEEEEEEQDAKEVCRLGVMRGRAVPGAAWWVDHANASLSLCYRAAWRTRGPADVLRMLLPAAAPCPCCLVIPHACIPHFPARPHHVPTRALRPPCSPPRHLAPPLGSPASSSR